MGGGGGVYGALVPSIPPRMGDIRTTSVPPYLELRWGASAPPLPPPLPITISQEEGGGM